MRSEYIKIFGENNFPPRVVIPKLFKSIENLSVTFNNVMNRNLNKVDVFTKAKFFTKFLNKPMLIDEGWQYL